MYVQYSRPYRWVGLWKLEYYGTTNYQNKHDKYCTNLSTRYRKLDIHLRQQVLTTSTLPLRVGFPTPPFFWWSVQCLVGSTLTSL
ncbi:hypothetical protein BO86DRAFT_27322 [Aspergillus japonicus CBS 114.51]|uniref:Uncharacterized protein n=1 Tax=Aspergillus japonicus CBS 114.51 TaxID=1448312 RepID=A0A8T8WKL5_ASPJA|nr:hypothetical protein BO86DRAFT_27322 [Aspergillus japonicus CBS 114.51]RAH76224.1 hypothetical protein BO86DRAFT_27322 [Aspergillus japonicus CBS 114.51]